MPTQSELKTVMFDAAEAARKVLLRHFGRIDSVETKGVADLVTLADKTSDAAVLRVIRRSFPDHAILAEESGGADEPVEGYCWVVDPLDGTTNYAHGVPIFSVSIGLLRVGEPYMGLIVDPVHDDWYFARRGGGAFLGRRRMHVSQARSLEESLLVTGFPHGCRRDLRHFTEVLEGLLMRSRGVLRLGSAALDLCWVASGRVEAFWEENLSAWDVAAGALIVEEAGGRCGRLDRKKFTVFGRQILATNGHVHREMFRTIRSTWKPW